MAFPLLGLLAGAGTGAALRYGPHILRYLYPRVAPKAATGAQRLGQLLKNNYKAAAVGGATGLIGDMMSPEEAYAPTGPRLPNVPQPQEPLPSSIVPHMEMPFGVGNHSPMPNAQAFEAQGLKPHINEPMQARPVDTAAQTPPPAPTDLEKFLQSNTYKFFQSDAYKKLQDLFAGMAAAPSGGSGWDALASGVKQLHAGDKQRGQVNQTVEYLKSKGYSEEEARVMASNPQMLSALLTGDDKPKLSPDYQRIFNPQTGEYEAKVIKGSKAYNEIQQREQLKKLQIVDAKIMRESTAYTINEALGILKKNPKASTGAIGQFLQYLWNTPASRLKNHLEAIRGGVMLHKLERIKALSPNGASGLGNLTDREGKTLESVYGALQQSSSPEDLIKNLQRLQEIYNKATDAQIAILMNDNITAADVDEAFGSSAQHSIDSRMSQGGSANAPVVKSAEEFESLPQGAKFWVVNTNGKVVPVIK
ncbi:hypothetical protein [Bartonella sp. ML70XJBT.G]|uniref:hypothetical protein n=1 Tax=Bartonella sp. ML70XJBT.G TaxID=3019093 RepID=UPI00235DD035|nr:hypothetical protein [Bartonella sp. ML70XJBT.G]